MKFSLKVLLIGLGILLLFEVYVRLFVVSPAVVRFDAELGPMKAPFSHILRTYEGHGAYTNDAFGLNNDPLPETLPARRMLVLGDSFVEAKHVSREENFVARLHAYPDVLAYNAGYSGADPRSFPVLAGRLLPYIKPTRMVLCVNADDFSALTTDALPAYEPPTGIKAWLQPIFAHSALATHLNWKYKPVFQAWWQKWTQPRNSKQHHEALGDEHTTHAAHWAHILRKLADYHVPMLLVALPKIHYEAGTAVAVADERLETMIRVAESQKLAVLRLEEVFIQDFRQSGQVAFGFMNSHLGTGHLNAHGHALVAQALVKALSL